MSSDSKERELLNLLSSVKDDGRGTDLPSGSFILIKCDGSGVWSFDSSILERAVAEGLVKSERTLRLTDEGQRFLKEKGNVK